jgi:hypothetical protein
VSWKAITDTTRFREISRHWAGSGRGCADTGAKCCAGEVSGTHRTGIVSDHSLIDGFLCPEPYILILPFVLTLASKGRAVCGMWPQKLCGGQNRSRVP